MIPLLEQHHLDLDRLCRKHLVRRLEVFGSAADETFNPESSDLDFLVELNPGRTLLDLVGLRTELSQLFDRPVDVVTNDSLKPSLRSEVLRDAIAVIS